LDEFAHAAAEDFSEVADKERNVLGAFAESRDADGKKR